MSQRFMASFFLFTVITLLSLNAFSSDRFEISEGWKFKSGDQIEWSTVEFDDGDWENIKVPKLLFQKKGQAVVGWYRVNFDVLSLGGHELALFIETIRHADEVWINGVKVGSKGEVHGAWDLMHTNPQSLPRLYRIPNYVLKQKNNVLAIRFNTGFGEATGAMFPGGAGITKGKVYIGDYDELLPLVHHKELGIIMIDSVFAVLGVLDLLIIIFLIKTALGPIPEYRWLLITSFFLLLGTVAQDIDFIYSLHFLNANFLMMTAMLALPYTTAMYFWTQDQNLSRYIVVCMSLLWMVSVFVILYPGIPHNVKNDCWHLWKSLALIFLFYSVYVAFRGVVSKRTGAVAQLLGLIVCVVFIRSQWLPDYFFGHRNIQIGSLFYRYALLVAYFQQMAHMRVDFNKLNAKLVGVVENVQHSIARELHDGIGQHLASARLQAKIVEKTTGQQFPLIEQELNSSITGIRRLINGLHPVSLEELNVVEAIRLECKNLEASHPVKITIVADECELDKKIEANIFRMFQECAGNAIHHGSASELMFSLKVQSKQVSIHIQDNGKGFVTEHKSHFKPESGYGLISLNERVVLLNGTLKIHSKLGKGTSVYIAVPFSN